MAKLAGSVCGGGQTDCGGGGERWGFEGPHRRDVVDVFTALGFRMWRTEAAKMEGRGVRSVDRRGAVD